MTFFLQFATYCTERRSAAKPSSGLHGLWGNKGLEPLDPCTGHWFFLRKDAVAKTKRDWTRPGLHLLFNMEMVAIL